MIFKGYLAREFLRFTFMITLFFSGLYSVIDFLEKNSRYFPKYNASGAIILEYYLLQMPKLVVELLPFATLFGAIITLWLFSRSGEIAAARTSGASIVAIGAPLFASGIILAALSFALSEGLVPKAQTRLRYIETVKIERSRLSRMFLESHWIRSGEAVMHFESYDRIRGVLRDPTLYIFDGPNALKSVSRSSRAYFDPRSESWILQDAIETSFHYSDAGREITSVDPVPKSKGGALATQGQEGGQSHRGPHLASRFIQVLDSRLTAEPPRILSANVGSTDLGFLELLKLMRESEQAGISAQKRLIDLYQKVSLPLANVLFIFLAMPFCIRHERQTDTYAGIFVALALALVYWAGNFALRTLAQNGHVPPVFAAFAMSGLLLLFGLWQLRTLTHRI